ncbi:MAG: hypothetical protein K2L87_03870, partial [Clostridiales bacterium]|nr:hypothetical protein [Clostridiales bacterium]
EKDSDGNYLLDEHGNVATGHYYISTAGGSKRIVMCIDPETNAPYEKRTIDDMKNDDLIEDAAIGDLITIDENSSGLMKSISSWKIGDMKDQSKIESLSVGDVMEISPDATGLMAAIREWTIGNLKQQHRIERLKVSDVIMQGDNPSNLFNAIGNWRIKDLTSQEKIDTLMLSSILGIDENSPRILQALADTYLGHVDEAVKSLPLKDFLGDDLDDNKLLRTLQNSTVETLSDDIKNLSISDVFAEDAYSYATTYQEGARPTGKVSREDVVSHYVVGETEVVKGYFRADGTLVTGEIKYDAQIALDNRGEGATFHTPYYVEDRVILKPVYTWMVVNYDTGELEPMTENLRGLERHPVSEDEAYVLLTQTDESGKTVETRYDLERVTSYAYENGAPLSEADSAKRVYTETADETTRYYIIERVEVFERYYAESDPTATFETAELRFETADGTAVTRYLGGLWYLLLGEGADAAENTKILDIGENMATAITTINHMTLGEMYVHEILDTNPDVDISRIPNNPTGKENLNELTIAGVIGLITAIANA